MAYTDFTLKKLKKYFNIDNKQRILFTNVKSVEASPMLKHQLKRIQSLSIKSEKARSEFIVAPILLELRESNNNFFTVYSGDTLTADKEKGLTGECDFILTKDVSSYAINLPILTLVEAKKHDLDIGVPQCAAQMVGAKIFNEGNGENLDVIYGCVTTGENWKFMRLINNTIEVDENTYFLSNLDKILGVFQEIIDYYKSVLGEENKE